MSRDLQRFIALTNGKTFIDWTIGSKDTTTGLDLTDATVTPIDNVRTTVFSLYLMTSLVEATVIMFVIFTSCYDWESFRKVKVANIAFRD